MAWVPGRVGQVQPLVSYRTTGESLASSFAWLDYSERERRQVRDVLDLFREQETRDELGIGQIRDAFADLLFPGTTTIMTRARYFLFVPWIYLRLEQNRVPAARVLARLREEENRLTKTLLASGESDGVTAESPAITSSACPATSTGSVCAAGASVSSPAGRPSTIARSTRSTPRSGAPWRHVRTPPRSSTCAATGTAACRRPRSASPSMPRCASLKRRPPTSASASPPPTRPLRKSRCSAILPGRASRPPVSSSECTPNQATSRHTSAAGSFTCATSPRRCTAPLCSIT